MPGPVPMFNAVSRSSALSGNRLVRIDERVAKIVGDGLIGNIAVQYVQASHQVLATLVETLPTCTGVIAMHYQTHLHRY